MCLILAGNTAWNKTETLNALVLLPEYQGGPFKTRSAGAAEPSWGWGG